MHVSLVTPQVGGSGGAEHIAKLLSERGVTLEVVVDEGGVILEDGVAPLTRHPVALVATAEKVYSSIQVELASAGGHSSMPPIDGSDVATQVSRLVDYVRRNPLPGG